MKYVYIITHPDCAGSVNMRVYEYPEDAESECSRLNEKAAKASNSMDYEVEELKFA